MIKLPGLLLPFALLYGEATVFLLPDEQSRFSNHLAHALKSSSDTLLIITPSFHHSELKKAILQGAKKGTRVTLIVQDIKGDPLSMVQYERTDLYTYTARSLEGSVLLIDNRIVCTLPGGIEEEKFSRDASLVRCSDDPSEAALYRSALLPLIKRSKKYLE